MFPVDRHPDTIWMEVDRRWLRRFIGPDGPLGERGMSVPERPLYGLLRRTAEIALDNERRIPRGRRAFSPSQGSEEVRP
jgi:hypothetical protein